MPLVVAKKTYDAEKDFTPIAQVGYVPLAVVVTQRFPHATWPNLPRWRRRSRRS